MDTLGEVRRRGLRGNVPVRKARGPMKSRYSFEAGSTPDPRRHRDLGVYIYTADPRREGASKIGRSFEGALRSPPQALLVHNRNFPG